MVFSPKNIKKLRSKGLVVDDISVAKPKGAAGNHIPFYEACVGTRTYDENRKPVCDGFLSDCPVISVDHFKEKIRITMWEYTPGPGPGDFDLLFEEEEAAIDFLLSYYFGENEYFEAKKRDVYLRHDGLTFNEFQQTFSALLESIRSEFGEGMIDFETNVYKKVDPAHWTRINWEDQQKEVPYLTESLHRDVVELKRIILEGKACGPDDWERLSSVLLELSRMAKKKAADPHA